MADDKPADVDVAPSTGEDPKQDDKSATARKKSLGGLDSSVVLSGPRQRKKADHFQVEVKEKADFVIKAGKGTKLGEIPNVHFLLGKVKTDDELLTSLHNLLFKRPGVAHRRKKNLYEFSGLTFDDDDKEKEMEKVQERLSKWTIPLLNGALDVFELPRGNGDEGKKEAKVERLLKFLEEPKKLSEKDLAAQAAKKKDAAKAKKEKEQKSKTPKSSAKGGRKSESGQESSKKKRTKKAESEDEAAEEPSEEEEEETGEEDEKAEPEPEQPKKRVKKEETASAKKASEKKTPVSRKGAGKKRKADDEAGAAAEEATADAPSGGGPAVDGAVIEAAEDAGTSDEFPDDDAIKEATLELLKVSDVNTTTVKHLLAKLNEKFDTDLAKKKSLIKRVAVDYAQSKAAASDEAGAVDAEEVMGEEVPPPAKKPKKVDDGDTAPGVTTEAPKDAGSSQDAKEAAPQAEEAAAGEPVAKAKDEAKEGKAEEGTGDTMDKGEAAADGTVAEAGALEETECEAAADGAVAEPGAAEETKAETKD